MAGPIATLAVRLSAQLAEFQTSFKDATKTVDAFKTDFEQFASKINSTIDGVSKAFSGFGANLATVGVAIAGVAAAGGAAILAFKAIEAAVSTVAGIISNALTSTANLGDEFFTLSQKTGLSVEALSGFKFAAAQTGTSLDAITGAVFKLEANLGKGGKATEDAIKGIGLSLASLKNAAPEDAFQQIIEKLAEIPNASDRAAAGVALFGKSFKDIAVLAAEGKGGLSALTAQAKGLGVVMSTETAVASDRLHDGLNVLSQAAAGLTQTLGAKLIPAAVAFTEVFGGIFLDAIKAVVTSTQGAGEGFDRFVVFVGEAAARFLEVLAKMVEGTAQWAVDTSKRIADQARAFLDLAPTIITVGRALDLALGGGTHQAGFDALANNLEALRKPLDSVAAGAVLAGSTIRTVAAGIAEAAKGAGANFGASFAKIQGEIAVAADKMRASLKGVASATDGAGGEDAFKSFTKGLGELTAQIERAKANGAPLATLLRLFGEEAAKSADKAHAWGITVHASVDEVARAFNAAKLDTVLDKLSDGFRKFFDSRAEAQFKKLQAGMHDSAVEMVKLDATLKKLDSGFEDFFAKRSRERFDGLAKGMHDAVPQVIAELTNPFATAFTKLGRDLPNLLIGALQGGSTVSLVSTFAAGAGSAFTNVFLDAVARAAEGKGKVLLKEKFAGLAGVALQSLVAGLQIGAAAGGVGKGALLGAGTGAATGAVTAGPAGAVVGGIVGLVSGAIGGLGSRKEQELALRQSKDALLVQLGGLQKMRDLVRQIGAESGFAKQLQTAFDTRDPKAFAAAVAQVNEGLATYNKGLEGISRATDAVNARTATFAKQFGEGLPTDKIQEIAQRTQPEFERLGVAVQATFAAIIKSTGDGFAAIQQLAPSFETLKKGISEFGLTSTGVIDSLLGSFDLVNSELTGPFLQNVQNSGAILKGLFDAKGLNAESFQALAADIGQNLQEVANRGGDMAKAFALSQPVLQALFEAQQTFGGVTDQTTQSILAQAEAQGIVGNQFKSTQQKTLEILLAIADVFGAKIPDGIRATADAAQHAADVVGTAFGDAADQSGHAIEFKVGRGLDAAASAAKTTAGKITNEFGRITVPEIIVPAKIDLDASAFDRIPDDIRIQTGFDVPAFATGGIVRRRTLAIIGEAGPEAVVPLGQLPTLRTAAGARRDAAPVVFGPGAVVIHGDVDTDARAERVVRDFARAMRRGGDARTLALRSIGLEKV